MPRFSLYVLALGLLVVAWVAQAEEGANVALLSLAQV